MKQISLVLILLLSLYSGAIKAQNGYDIPADAPIINTYVPIDWEAILNIRNLSVQVKKKRIMEAYASYPYYPNIINDGWHNVVSVTSDVVLSHKAFVGSNRIIKVVIHDETVNTDIEIVNGRCICSELIVYFLEDTEAYNRRMLN